MSATTILISGANRGLGKGLLERYLVKPNHTVIAANRNPEHATSKALFDLPTGPGSRLIVVKIDASVETDPATAVKSLTQQGIDHIDVVVANAGVGYAYVKVSDLKTDELQGHLTPMVFGVVWLYQATLPLLLKSKDPKWITMGSTAGSITDQMAIPNAAYGPSKAAVHWLTKRMNAEVVKLIAFVISPGWVQTDLGNFGARNFGMDQALVTVEDSCDGMVLVIDGATKASHGGKFFGHEGNEFPW